MERNPEISKGQIYASTIRVSKGLRQLPQIEGRPFLEGDLNLSLSNLNTLKMGSIFILQKNKSMTLQVICPYAQQCFAGLYMRW